MHTKRTLSLTTLIILAMMMTVLAGCSDSNEQSNSAPASTANEGTAESAETAGNQEAATEYPIVIKHAFGETVLASKPERVATIQWANHDVALALGVVPVGFSAANYGVQDDSGLLPWTAAKLKELGVDDPNVFQDTDGLDFEAIADSNPDVILAAYSGITQEDYDILSEIAPVVAYPTTPWVITWREQVRYNALGMGMEAEGEQLIQDTEKLIQEKASENPEIQGKKIVWANFSSKDLSQIYVYTPADPRAAFLIEMGMEYPESVMEQLTDDSGFSLKLSAENADVLYDADLLVTYGGDELYEAMKSDPLLGKIPAVQRGSIVFIGDSTPLAASVNPNPLAVAYTIDEYVKLIGEAIAKINE